VNTFGAATTHDLSSRWADVGRPVSRRAVIVAHLIPFTVLPSGIWRTVLGFGVTLGLSRASLEADHLPGRGTVMVISLTLLTEALALLSLGLVRPWGEVVPQWVPGVRGRRIPPAVAVVPATVGGVMVTLMWVYAVSGILPIEGLHRSEEISGAGWSALLIACYAPALLWGPLLLWLTRDYYRRRRS
jgi:hypothetical protein